MSSKVIRAQKPDVAGRLILLQAIVIRPTIGPCSATRPCPVVGPSPTISSAIKYVK